MKLTWTYEEGDEGLLIDDIYTCNELPLVHIQDSDSGYVLWEETDDITMLVLGTFRTLTEAKCYLEGIY